MFGYNLRMIYKSVQALSLVLSLAFFLCGIAGAQEAPEAPEPAYTNPYIVEGVEVDITAKNAIEARDQAFNAAQEKAFGELAKRMLPEGEAATYKIPTLSTISALIKDYEVTKEKLSSVRYLGTYTFHFDEDGVNRVFNSTGPSYADSSSSATATKSSGKSLLILPFFQADAEMILWSQDNPWLNAWNRSNQSFATIPIGDLEDVQDIGDTQALTYSSRRLNDMLDRYNAGEAIILVAAADSSLVARNDDDQASGGMSINVYRTDRGSPEFIQEIPLNAQPGQSVGQFMDESVASLQSFLKQNWKQTMTASTSPEISRIDVVVPIRTLADWSAAEVALYDTGGITDVMLQGISPREARITITYQGSQQRLMEALAQENLVLMKGAQPANSQNQLFAPATYILTTRNAAHDTMRNEPPAPQPYSRQF